MSSDWDNFEFYPQMSLLTNLSFLSVINKFLACFGFSFKNIVDLIEHTANIDIMVFEQLIGLKFISR